VSATRERNKNSNLALLTPATFIVLTALIFSSSLQAGLTPCAGTYNLGNSGASALASPGGSAAGCEQVDKEFANFQDPLFTFTDTGVGFSISGSLTATDNGNGTFTATSGSGFFNGDAIVLIPGSGTSPLGAFVYNDLLYPTGNPLLDTSGLLFQDTVTGAELNIWGNGASSPYSTYTYVGGLYVLQDNNSVFNLAEVAPEPATWTMLALGLGLIAAWRRGAAAKRLGS